MKSCKRIAATALIAIFAAILICGAGPAWAKKTIIFADFGWDSAQVHNRIAGFIVEKGLGYPVKYVQGETIMLNTALIQAKGGETPNVTMETWTENWQQLYDEGLAKGKDPNTNEGFINLGANFPNSVQGWYVPRYVVEGDPDRGIKPMAPDLKSVFDLPKYWKLFKDPEDPSKGIFYSCIPGWSCAMVNEKKFKAYDIEKKLQHHAARQRTGAGGLHGNGLQAGKALAGILLGTHVGAGKAGHVSA